MKSDCRYLTHSKVLNDWTIKNIIYKVNCCIKSNAFGAFQVHEATNIESLIIHIAFFAIATFLPIIFKILAPYIQPFILTNMNEMLPQNDALHNINHLFSLMIRSIYKSCSFLDQKILKVENTHSILHEI